jgi:hypothetical protein
MVIFMIYTIHEMMGRENQEGWAVYGRELERLEIHVNLMDRENLEDLKSKRG